MKEGTARRQSSVWFVISGGVLIASAITALYTPWLGIVDVRQIAVSGNQTVSAVELAELSGIRRGQTLFSVPTRRVQQRLLTHPWVRRADVRRDFPHTIRLIVQERTAVAWAHHPETGAHVVVAEGGVVVDAERAGLPSLEVVGLSLTGWLPGDRVTEPRVVELVEAAQQALCERPVRALDVTDPTSVELLLESGTRVRVGGLADAMARLEALEVLCREISIDDYELVDVRLGGEATLVPRKAVRR